MSQRVHQVAKELGLTSKELVAKLGEMGVTAKNHMSSVDDAVAEQLRSAHASTTSSSANAVAAPVKSKPKKPPQVAQSKVSATVSADPAEVLQPTVAPEPPPAPSPKTAKVEVPTVPTESSDTEPERTKLQLDFPITVKEFAIKLDIKPSELIQRFIGLGVFVNINQALDQVTAQQIASQYAIELEGVPTI